MVSFAQKELDLLSAECIKRFAEQGWNPKTSDKREAIIPLCDHPDFEIYITGHIDPEDPENKWLGAVVRSKESGYIVGAVGFDNQAPTDNLIRVAVEQCLNSFADFYNAIEKGENPKPFPWPDKALSARISFAKGRQFLTNYIKTKDQPTHTQPAKTTENIVAPEKKKSVAPTIEFTQEDINKLAAHIFAQVKPETFTGRGRSDQTFMTRLDQDTHTALYTQILRDKGGKTPHFTLWANLAFKNGSIAIEEKPINGLPTEKDFVDLIKKVTDDFSDICNAVKKGERFSLPHLRGGPIAQAEFKRDFIGYIRYGDTPVTQPKTYEHSLE